MAEAASYHTLKALIAPNGSDSFTSHILNASTALSEMLNLEERIYVGADKFSSSLRSSVDEVHDGLPSAFGRCLTPSVNTECCRMS
jgi:hypothetical protein